MTAKRPALGRGLDALLGDSRPGNPTRETESVPLSPDSEEGVIGAIAAIPIDQIDANPFQPRTQFNDNSLEELCQSIRINGVITPITVRKTGHRYQLISGERRLRASKLAGLAEIPAFIRMANDNQSLEMALIENIQREDLNAIDVALSFQALMDAYKYNQDELSKRVGKGRSTVANFLRLLNLPAVIQLYLKDNKISMGHARCLVGIENEEKQLELAQMVIKQDLSVRQLENLIRKKDDGGSKTLKDKVVIPEWCKEAKQKLSDKISAKISLKPGRKGKGSLVIDYGSEEELQRIFNLLNE